MATNGKDIKLYINGKEIPIASMATIKTSEIDSENFFKGVAEYTIGYFAESLDDLKHLLNEAVENEDYETAAKIRDYIKKYE